MSTMQDILQIDNYTLSYAGTSAAIRILDGVSLRIGRGEVLALVGESGSAKSSLANAIMRDLPGRVAHESGEIRLGGQNLVPLSESELGGIRGRRIAMVLQNAATALNPTMTMGEHVRETLKHHHATDDDSLQQKTVDALEQVGLPDPTDMSRRYAHQMSGGEKQRVVLAMALACEPELILFDEPTSALDATTAANFLDLFAGLQKRTGISGLFISHDLGVVSAIADRVAVIYGGRIVETAETQSLFGSPVHPYTRALLDSLARPSDTRTGRQITAVATSPPPRDGERPSCIYAANCPWHEPDRCDTGFVTLASLPESTPAVKGAADIDAGNHQVACVRRADLLSRSGDEQSGRSSTSAPPTVGETVLSTHGMTVRYGRPGWFDRLRGRSTSVHAVREVSLSLRRGETLALVGESGCGKSTLARALAGLVAFDGELHCLDRPVAHMDRDYRARVQLVFQNPDSSLNPRHSIHTILERPLVLYRQDVPPSDRSERIGELLERVQLPAHYMKRYPHELSGGEKQRVAIARALAAEPDVIICDEITSGLDASVQASITRLLRQIQHQSGTALIFITHDLAILRHLAHRIAVMYLGEVVELMDIQTLDAPPYHPYTEALLSSSPSIDPLTETRRVRLRGALPVRSIRLPGCVFESRCPHRLGPQCANDSPPRQTTPEGHQILCHIDRQTLSSHAPVWRPLAIETRP